MRRIVPVRDILAIRRNDLIREEDESIRVNHPGGDRDLGPDRKSLTGILAEVIYLRHCGAVNRRQRDAE